MWMLALLMVALIGLAVVSPIGLVKNVSAQQIGIETSADSHDHRFFGQGVLQVVVDDPNADDDNTVEDISVEITANADGAGGDSVDISVPETKEGSGKFELFLIHVDATQVGPDDLDPLNTAGVEGDGTCSADCAPFITFGPGGDLDVDADLYNDIRFEIVAHNAEAKINYEETYGSLKLDRDSYGSTSYVYVAVVDQDANLNPFERDEFPVDPVGDPNSDLLVLDGGTFEEAIMFRETGDNTAVFEGRYRLGVSMLVDTETPALTLHEKANYDATLAAEENDSKSIDEISFIVGNTDGSIVVGGGQHTIPSWDPVINADKSLYAPGDVVQITITDQDANGNPGSVDSIQLHISSDGNDIEVSALETGTNTGVFKASFTLEEQGGSALIIYTDKHPADYSEKVHAGQDPEKDFTFEIDIQLPVKIGIEATDITTPVSKDVTGGGGPLEAGNSVTLSTIVSNNNDEPQAFVTLIEVRDGNSTTVFLALQGGTLEPSGSTEIGVLWRPDHAGMFEVRTFVVTSIGAGGEVLSPVASSKVTII